MVLRGYTTLVTFPVHALLVDRTKVFGAEGPFWRESWEYMGTSENSLPTDSSSDKSQKILVSVGSSSGNVWTISVGLYVQKISLFFRNYS